MIIDIQSYAAIIATTYFIFSFNPIVNLAILILLFIFSALLFIQLEFYFLGLTYIIVYVGAIAVLFQFVIMMVSTKIEMDNRIKFNNSYKFTIFYLIFSSAILMQYNSNQKMNLFFYFYPSWVNDFIYQTDLQSLGFTQFLNLPILIILISFLLWQVLIGVQAITEEKS